MVKYNLVIIANYHAYNFINKSNEPAREPKEQSSMVI